MHINGPAVVVGDDINTDVMYPGRYLTEYDPEEQAKHLFEGLGDEWPAKIKRHKVVVGGWNMGAGSSREQVATGLLAAGVQVVVAKSFSRLFFRNAINNGLPLVESPELAESIREGDEVIIDLAKGEAQVRNLTIRFEPLPPRLQEIVTHRGLWGWLKAKGPKKTEKGTRP
ncbi:MAG: 3-isopropylmalate dehydratase small subunit [Rhodospirillales bacterium]|nr:3-isopropylmalate dehydratase small subunit [Rhodospirillales bacterium]